MKLKSARWLTPGQVRFQEITRALVLVIAAWTVSVCGAELTFDGWAEAFAIVWVRADPELATTTQYFDGAEQDSLDRQLTPVTKAYRAERVAFAKRGLSELTRFNAAELTPSQKVSFAMLRWQLDDIVRAEPFEEYRLVFQQFSGLQVQLVNFLSQTHPIRNRRDIQNYLARLQLVAPLIDEGIAQAKERA